MTKSKERNNLLQPVNSFFISSSFTFAYGCRTKIQKFHPSDALKLLQPSVNQRKYKTLLQLDSKEFLGNIKLAGKKK